jgi:hypothetical protein
LIYGPLLFRSSSLHLCVSGHFNNRWASLSYPAHRRHLPLAALATHLQQDVYTSLPHECFSSLCSDKDVCSLISSSRLCLWMSAHLSLIIWDVVLNSVSLAICHIQPSPIVSSYSLSVHAQHSTLGCPTRH